MKKKGGWRNCPEVESLLLTAPAEDQIPSVHVRWLITACNSSFKDPMCTLIFSIVHEKVRLPKLLIIVPFTLCLQMSILIFQSLLKL